ncbi:hypothetical protein [Cribrihabitans marinus]|uniref:hypothetical protein n=1 Tax=Cribrihabitans marinus TaxID=1227549 RepID=UPI0015A5B7B9|nr:hypothetical protein [Cribrihabitans marinus]
MAQALKMGKRAEAFPKIFGAVFREYQSRLCAALRRFQAAGSPAPVHQLVC